MFGVLTTDKVLAGIEKWVRDLDKVIDVHSDASFTHRNASIQHSRMADAADAEIVKAAQAKSRLEALLGTSSEPQQ